MRPAWHPLFLKRSRLCRELSEHWVAHDMPGDYARWLIKAVGRPMERALIRARQRYEAQKPKRIRASQLHRAYRARRR